MRSTVAGVVDRLRGLGGGDLPATLTSHDLSTLVEAALIESGDYGPRRRW